MIVGSNERRYAWMDEGFNTYQNAFSNERRVPGTDAFPAYLANWRAAVDNGRQAPLMTPPDRIDAERRSARSAIESPARCCSRSATTSSAARRWIARCASTCGDGRSSIRRPAISFARSRTCRAQDLSWFWNAFFYGTDVLDIAVDGVTMRQAKGESVAEVHLRRVTTIPFPVTMRLKLNDGIDPGRAPAGRDLDARRSLHRDDPGAAACRRRSALARPAVFPIGTRRTTSGATCRRPMLGPPRRAGALFPLFRRRPVQPLVSRASGDRP